jgi:hypothetical protein
VSLRLARRLSLTPGRVPCEYLQPRHARQSLRLSSLLAAAAVGRGDPPPATLQPAPPATHYDEIDWRGRSGTRAQVGSWTACCCRARARTSSSGTGAAESRNRAWRRCWIPALRSPIEVYDEPDTDRLLSRPRGRCPLDRHDGAHLQPSELPVIRCYPAEKQLSRRPPATHRITPADALAAGGTAPISGDQCRAASRRLHPDSAVGMRPRTVRVGTCQSLVAPDAARDIGDTVARACARPSERRWVRFEAQTMLPDVDDERAIRPAHRMPLGDVR